MPTLQRAWQMRDVRPVNTWRPEPARAEPKRPASPHVRAALERTGRAAWRNQALRFLQWAARERSFAAAALMPHVGNHNWRSMVKFLYEMGFIIKDGEHANAPYALPYDDRGERLTIADVMNDARWFSSFKAPPRKVPDIPVCPSAQAQDYTPLHTHTHEDAITHAENDAITKGEDENGERHAREAAVRAHHRAGR